MLKNQPLGYSCFTGLDSAQAGISSNRTIIHVLRLTCCKVFIYKYEIWGLFLIWIVLGKERN